MFLCGAGVFEMRKGIPVLTEVLTDSSQTSSPFSVNKWSHCTYCDKFVILICFLTLYLGCNLNNLEMSHCLCADNAPALSVLDLQLLELPFWFVTRVLSKQGVKFHEYWWKKQRHWRTRHLLTYAYSVLSPLCVVCCVWRVVCSVASRFAGIPGAEIVDYTLSDSRSISSLQEVQWHCRNLSTDYIRVPRFHGSNLFPRKYGQNIV